MFHTQLLALDSAHYEHTLTLLADGDALLLGGLDAAGAAQTTALRYVVDTGRFEPVSPLPVASRRHTATLLPGGDVLVVGVGEAEGDAFRYRTATDSWQRVAALATPRIEHAAILLADGSVLVCGGRSCAALDGKNDNERHDVELLRSAERFDPATGSWSAAASLVHGRRKHALLALPDGALLAVGGKVRAATGVQQRARTGERLEAGGKAWAELGKMEASEHDFCVLADGRVIAQGGHLYEPRRGVWHRVEAGFRGGGPLLLLADGRVACFGAFGEELYDPAEKTWTPVGPARKLPQRGHLVVLLRDGRALAVGGNANRGKAAAYAALVDIDLDWQPTPIEPDDMDSAERLLEMLVDNGALELDDPDDGIEPLIEPVARLLRYTEGAGNQAGGLSRLLLDHDAVADFFLDDQQLKKLLAQW